MSFDLDAEEGALLGERPYTEGDRNAKTLFKSGSHRLVLVVLRAGARFDEADQRGYVTLFIRRGRLSLEISSGASSELAGGHAGVIEPGQPWSTVAVEDSSVLMSLSWPPQP
jgi:quercetin dioxygenase-like cupin family protein